MSDTIDLDKLTDIEIPENFTKGKRDRNLRDKIDISNPNSHIHHIIPIHMGGTNDPENLIELTIEQHAEAHRLLYKKYGYVEDLVAWNCLSGKTEYLEMYRKELAESGYRAFLNNPEKVKARNEKIRKWNLGKRYGIETRRKHSENLKRQHAEGRRKSINHYVDTEWYRQHWKNNRFKLAEGRRNSALWRESVTSDDYRKRHSELFKGREITWGDEISKAKKGKVLYNSMLVEVDGVKYNSMTILSEKMGFKRHAVAKYIEVHKLEPIDGCYYIEQTYEDVVEDIKSRLKLPYLVEGVMLSSLSKVANHFKVSQDMIKTFKRTNINNEYYILDIDYDRIERAKKRKNYNK